MELSDDTLTIVFNLQRRLLKRIDEATATEAIIFEQFGEAEIILVELEQLYNIRERLTSSYSRYTLLLRVAESQPTANSATINLLAFSIDQADATIQEIKGDLDWL